MMTKKEVNAQIERLVRSMKGCLVLTEEGAFLAPSPFAYGRCDDVGRLMGRGLQVDPTASRRRLAELLLERAYDPLADGEQPSAEMSYDELLIHARRRGGTLL